MRHYITFYFAGNSQSTLRNKEASIRVLFLLKAILPRGDQQKWEKVDIEIHQLTALFLLALTMTTSSSQIANPSLLVNDI